MVIDISKNLEKKLNDLISFLNGKKVIVAFSGGVDSSLLAYLSKKYAEKTLLVIANALIYSEEDYNEARNFAEKYKIPYEILEINPLTDKLFIANPPDRCYICKKSLFKSIRKIKDEKKYNLIIEGSNMDDLGDYRPGIQALKELEIESPYIKFNIEKREIRILCQYFDLAVHSKPSSACLASRIPYTQSITSEKLKIIDKAEYFLKKRFNLNQLRVRLHDDNLARIEFLTEDLPKILKEKNLIIIKNKLKQLGFIYITIDLEGFRSGSLNKTLE